MTRAFLMRALADQLLQETGPQPPAMVTSDDGAVVLLRHRFEPSEGSLGHPHQLRLGMPIDGGGRLQQRSQSGLLQGVWQPGQFNVVLPGDIGTYASPAVEVLGVAIDTGHHPLETHQLHVLQPLAARLQRDPVVTSVLHALWCSAQADACLPGFLEHGAQVLLHRLQQLAGHARATPPRGPALSVRQLQRLQEYIDTQYGQPLAVAQLAAALQMDPSTFSRALRAATGLPPYAFLTQRRMQWARAQLVQGRNVTEVALACGYANPSKFSAAFRRVVGCPPSAWATQHRSPW